MSEQDDFERAMERQRRIVLAGMSELTELERARDAVVEAAKKRVAMLYRYRTTETMKAPTVQEVGQTDDDLIVTVQALARAAQGRTA